jgi:hypothetical protein
MEMNDESRPTLNIKLTGTLSIPHDELEPLLRRLGISAAQTAVVAPAPKKVEAAGTPQRLAYTMKETAEILGCSYITVYRLIQRGLLKSSTALRCKIIAKVEIERFLKETSRSAY